MNFDLSTRMRRLRSQPWLRDLVQEHRLSVKDLIYPLFLHEGENNETPVSSLPGVSRWTPDLALKQAQKAKDLGIPALLLFGVIEDDKKDFDGSIAFDDQNVVCETIRLIKKNVPDIGIIADVCFCEYTDHGHCGPITEAGDVDNDKTVEGLARQSLVLAKAGADIIAPSDMMDGRVAAIREMLDDNRFDHIPVLSYAAKFASNFYGPFREAAGCALGAYPHALKDRKTYQMNPANGLEAIREVALDVEEGADMLIVKPGLPYLDIIKEVKQTFALPVMAYHVSGEYAMVKAADQNGWVDGLSVFFEQMISFKRAGCDAIITYAALDLALYINSNE